MHDIDRTQLETLDSGEYESDEYEWETDQEYEGPLDEADELELASQLLEVTDEAELDQFLGKLFKKASRAMKSPRGRRLGALLKGIAKKALPIAGGALGASFGVPPAVGSNLGSAAATMFEMELEGLSAEDQEYEFARRFVKFAGEAARQAGQASTNVPPNEAARSAVVAAAQRYAPGLLRPAAASVAAGAGGPGRGHSGRWVRRGRMIILYGA